MEELHYVVRGKLAQQPGYLTVLLVAQHRLDDLHRRYQPRFLVCQFIRVDVSIGHRRDKRFEPLRLFGNHWRVRRYI
jgi:hypothetical protein